MKIAYCICSTFNSGGMERVLSNKIGYLIEKLGYEIFIITTDQCNRPPFFKFPSSVINIDLDINYSEGNKYNIFFKGIRYLWKKKIHKNKLANVLHEIKPDIVVSLFGNEVSFLPNIADGSLKILEIHFSKFFRRQFNRKGLWKLVDIIRSRQDECVVRKYYRFVVLTNEDKKYWGNIDNIVVIPNAAIPFSNELASLRSNRVVAIGRLSYQKDYESLIRIWKLIHERNSDLELHIYGAGELYDNMLSLIDSLNLNNIIHIFPPTKNVENIYLESSALVLTSRFEGLPMVLLEAMSCGVPVISFMCKCGPQDVISDGVDGFLVPEGNRLQFSQKVLEVMGNESLRFSMGANAKLKSKHFSEDNIMKLWIELFEYEKNRF